MFGKDICVCIEIVNTMAPWTGIKAVKGKNYMDLKRPYILILNTCVSVPYVNLINPGPGI